MKEGKFTAKLLRALRKHPQLKHAIIWKLSDRWTAGIPDFVVIFKGETTWFEVKVEPNLPTKLQLHWLKKISEGAFIISAQHDGRAATCTAISQYGETKHPYFTLDLLVERVFGIVYTRHAYQSFQESKQCATVG